MYILIFIALLASFYLFYPVFVLVLDKKFNFILILVYF